METIELAVLALALFFATSNIFVYSWFENRRSHLRLGLWVIRITGILPGLVATVWSIYLRATSTESVLAMALLVSGLLLVAGSLQFLSMLQRKLEHRAGKEDRPDSGGVVTDGHHE